MTSRATLIAAIACLTACASTSPPPMIGGATPVRRAGTESASEPLSSDRTLVIAPALGYDAVARLVRHDSIVLTLPSGQSQVQRTARTARFSVRVSASGEVDIRLDSLKFSPQMGSAGAEAIGARWSGRLGSHGLEELRVDRDDGVVKDLTSSVAQLIPELPRAGARIGDRWGDTTQTTRRVEIFDAQDRRQSAWTIGPARALDGLMVHPVQVTEHYEQLGEGKQAGRTMRMSAQGIRTATYYVTRAGRIDQIIQVDSASRLITIPETRQAIPTMQVVRTRVEFRYGG